MEWFSIGLLLFLGIVLMLAELIFIPGTTVVGILGKVFSITGLVLIFKYFGTSTGLITTGGYSILFTIILIYAFRSGTWKKFSLHKKITSRVNEELNYNLNIGDIGITVSALRPSGKVNFNDILIEAKTTGEYVNQGEKVRISKIDFNHIFVEPLIK